MSWSSRDAAHKKKLSGSSFMSWSDSPRVNHQTSATVVHTPLNGDGQTMQTPIRISVRSEMFAERAGNVCSNERWREGTPARAFLQRLLGVGLPRGIAST